MKKINPKVAPKSQQTVKSEIAATVQKEVETEEQAPIKIQRVFTLVGDTRKEIYRYIIIRISNTTTNKDAERLVDTICRKMTETGKEFKTVYKAVKNPEIDDEDGSYTDLIRYEKAEGKVSAQRQYVGKLMTRVLEAMSLNK